jgi:tetratricopeptide (TPR) repeat protein
MSRLTRILWPVLAGLTIGALVVGFLFWQLSQTTEQLRAQVEKGGSVTAPIADILGTNSSESYTNVSGGDAALTALRRGDLAALQSDWKTAESAYGQSVDLGAGLAAERKLAWAEIQRRKFEEATATINRLKQDGIRKEDGLLLESLVLLHTAQFADAEAKLAAAEDTPQKHYALALLSIAEQKHDDAKKQLTTVIQGWDPQLRDQAKVLQGAYDEFARFPNSNAEHLLTLLSRSLAAIQECELALPLLANVISHTSDYRDAWIVQGYCQLVTERSNDALLSLEHAYNLDPEKPEVQYFLGRAHASLGDHENAITFLKYSLSNGVSPADPVHRVLAKEAEATGNVPLQLEQLQALAQAETATLDDVTAYANLALSSGSASQADDTVRAAVNKWPLDAQARELLGKVLAAIGNKVDAMSAFEEAIRLDPTRKTALEKEMKKLK